MDSSAWFIMGLQGSGIKLTCDTCKHFTDPNQGILRNLPEHTHIGGLVPGIPCKKKTSQNYKQFIVNMLRFAAQQKMTVTAGETTVSLSPLQKTFIQTEAYTHYQPTAHELLSDSYQCLH